jgi:hypothetical protein
MVDEQQLQQLVDEILDSGRTPEEVCGASPEFLTEVHRRLRRIGLVEAELEAFFPGPPPDGTAVPSEPERPSADLPRVPGYEVEAVLGRGGVGVVFQARHLKLKRLVALKMLLAGAYAGPQELARFRREAEAVAALRHPHIVQVYDVGDLAGQPYFTMEFVEGGSLAQQLSTTRPLPRQAAGLVATLAGAMQFAHQSGILHRDLKPANILLTADGTPKITDFGLARSVSAGTEFTVSGTRLGTPSYMAPEQALGQTSAIGPAVDIYALGAVLYEALTGRPPFQGGTAAETERRVIAEEPAPPSRLSAGVPRDLETICLKCLHKSPARRYASAQELADDLRRFLGGHPVLARPVGVGERVLKWARRRPALATLTVALLVLLAAAVGIGIWQQQQRRLRQAVASQAIGNAMTRAYELGHADKWEDAKQILADAHSHLADADSDELRARIAQAREDVQFAEQLERIRQSAASSMMEKLYDELSTYPVLAKAYAQALAEDLDSQNRYNAACAAALAGCGLGAGAAQLDDEKKSAWRQQALDWLNADREAWTKRHSRGTITVQFLSAQTADAWQQCADLAGVRDPAALAQLPQQECQAWQSLWADVQALAAAASEARSRTRLLEAMGWGC